jgi:predicted ABC-type ATPase
MTDKNLYIIAGCNGAGKTTASYTVLPEILDCKEFVNADEIAHGLSPFNPEAMAIAAGRLMLKRIKELLNAEQTFSIETTLSTKSYVNLVHKAHAKGYEVNLLFFWLNSPELAVCRVAERVANGGHGIPEKTIKRRYVAGIRNLFKLYLPIVDYWEIWDNSIIPRCQVAFGSESDVIIKEESKFNMIKNYD